MSDKLKILIVFALLVAVFYPVYPDLVNAWMHQQDNSYGILVPFLSLYFIWNRRDKLTAVPQQSANWGFVLLTISLLIYLLALVGGVAFISRLMLVWAFAGLVLYVYGWPRFKVLSFPLIFLLFMVPVPVSIVGLITLPLQTFATKVSAGLIKACSIPVYREGNMLYFVQTQLEVAEACSGIRSLMALIMLSLVFVYLSKQGIWKKVFLVISAIPIALTGNLLRVSGTGILAHFYGDKVAQGFMHEFSGLAVFVFGMLILFLEFSVLNRVFKAQ